LKYAAPRYWATYSVASPSRREAFQWSEASGIVPIGDLPGGSFFSIAEAVSGDGSAVVGQSSSAHGYEPFLWTASDGMRALGEITGGSFRGWAFDISDDGKVVVGLNSENGTQAFAWTETGGRIDLGDVPGGRFSSFAHGVSGDGSIIVGVGEDDEGETAMIWDRFHGMRRLEDVLREFGVEPGIRLHAAWDVSSDGRTIIGSAYLGPGTFQGFVAVPEPVGLWIALAALCFLGRRSRTIARSVRRSCVLC
jgi:probable HAF family extracellular repeat protein